MCLWCMHVHVHVRVRVVVRVHVHNVQHYMDILDAVSKVSREF